MNSRISTETKQAYYEYVLRKASELSGVPAEEINSPSRKKEVAMAKHAIRYAMCMHSGWGLKEVGRVMLGCHHATVIHSREYINHGINNRSRLTIDDEMAVELAINLGKYIDEKLQYMNVMTSQAKRSIIHNMRTNGSNPMAVIGVVGNS